MTFLIMLRVHARPIHVWVHARAVLGLKSRTVSVRVTYHFVTLVSETCNKIVCHRTSHLEVISPCNTIDKPLQTTSGLQIILSHLAYINVIYQTIIHS